MTDQETLDTMKTLLQPINENLVELKSQIHEIQLTLENDTNKRINIVAEGHLDLSRKLDDALKVENEKEMLLLRVTALESEVRQLKRKIEQIA